MDLLYIIFTYYTQDNQQECFRLSNWFSLWCLGLWMNHLPPVWWSNFRFMFLIKSWCVRLTKLREIFYWCSVFIIVCKIKTGHSNLVSCFGPRMRALAKAFYRGESRGEIPCQRPNPRGKTWHKIWMTGLNPNFDTTPIPSLQNSQNKCQKSSFTYDHRRHSILPLPPVHALPIVNARTCC